VHVTPATRARERLLDHWVTDGRRGFFVDDAYAAADPPFSLYRTRWQLPLARHAGLGTAGVSPSGVRAWIAPALDGRMAGSGLPAIAQLDYAVHVLDLVGAPVNGPRVARTLTTLRSGGRYRTGPTAVDPDWGSTALAVRLLTHLGLPVPAEVADVARGGLRELAQVSVTPANVSQVISLSRIAAPLSGTPGWERLRGIQVDLVASAWETVSAAPAGAVATTLEVAVREIAGRLAVDLPPADVIRHRAALRAAASGVADPQLTCHVVELGGVDTRALTVAARSRAGWPSARAVARSLPASLAAIRSAASYGVEAEFLGPLRVQAEEIWVPAGVRPEDAADLGALLTFVASG
jgi:hypothetical protein